MQQRVIGLSLLVLVVAGMTVLLSERFHVASLAPSELKLKQQDLKPPAEPVTFEEDYAVARRKPCGKTEPVISTTICDVLRVPELFADKCIRVPGRFLSDGFEHSAIVDESCGTRGLIPWATEKETRKLDEAISQPGKGPETLHRRITARFTGRFVWKPKAQRNARVLEIYTVHNLKVEELPQR
jgi:hypothetical protein